MKIAIGTLNPAKVNAVKASLPDFEQFTFKSAKVPSGVSDQPFSDDETIQGAINRAENAREMEQADLGIGLEGGIIETNQGFYLCNWGAIAGGDIRPIIAGGARILLPDEVGKKVKSGAELGIVMDQYANQYNVSQNEGAIGIFTNGMVNRKEMFTHISKLLFGQYFYMHKKSSGR
ncbi:DUF84 family protein [Bacillus sp. OVS6]|uniref:DUF84 family protein n=1 Tax=Metabacillus dongyingensis TaxID=2874282 RepID=UPI001CBCFA9D|nr:DUF84 family protein [Metabacillus dongyingensis]UAL51366.1 DUF84 family protein [Metabacillus dongyingensis]UOK57293.1 DUF84 family protein [Bacillus sp. OVS6]